jgi:hypothetical protein
MFAAAIHWIIMGIVWTIVLRLLQVIIAAPISWLFMLLGVPDPTIKAQALVAGLSKFFLITFFVLLFYALYKNGVLGAFGDAFGEIGSSLYKFIALLPDAYKELIGP